MPYFFNCLISITSCGLKMHVAGCYKCAYVYTSINVEMHIHTCSAKYL